MPLKFLIGGFITLLIAYASNLKRFYYLSALIPLFPTFALITMFLVYKAHGPQGMRQTALFGMFSLIPYLSFLLAVFFLAERGFLLSILIGLTTWLFFALLIVKLSGAI